MIKIQYEVCYRHMDQLKYSEKAALPFTAGSTLEKGCTQLNTHSSLKLVHWDIGGSLHLAFFIVFEITD